MNWSRWLRVTPLLIVIPLIACQRGLFEPIVRGVSYKTTWESFGYDSYEFEQRFICFCTEPAGRFQRILVRNHEIVSVVDVETGKALEQDKYQLFKTVSQLHDFADSINPDSVATFNITYEPRFAYPTSIYVDYSEFIADEEIGYESRNLRPLR